MEFLYSLLSAPVSKKSISDPGRTQGSTAGLRDRDRGSRGTGCGLPNARCAEKGVSVVSVKGGERREWGRGEETRQKRKQEQGHTWVTVRSHKPQQGAVILFWV